MSTDATAASSQVPAPRPPAPEAGFWLSYAVLVLGLTRNWLGIAPASIQAAQELSLVAWMAVGRGTRPSARQPRPAGLSRRRRGGCAVTRT